MQGCKIFGFYTTRMSMVRFDSHCRKMLLIVVLSFIFVMDISGRVIDIGMFSACKSPDTIGFSTYLSGFHDINTPLLYKGPDNYSEVFIKSRNIDNSGGFIEHKYLDKFFFTNLTRPYEKDVYSYDYRYGVKFKHQDVIGTVVVRSCIDYPVRFGTGVKQYILTLYDESGRLKDQMLIGQCSADHRSKVVFYTHDYQKQNFYVWVRDTVMLEKQDDRMKAVVMDHVYFYDDSLNVHKRVDVYNIGPADIYQPKIIYVDDNVKDVYNAQETVSRQFWPLDTARLKKAYENLKSNSSESGQWEFFNAFPSRWKDFERIFRYDDTPGYDLTMFCYEKSFSLLFTSLFCPESDIAYWGLERVPYALGDLYIPSDVFMHKFVGILTGFDNVEAGKPSYIVGSAFSNLISLLLEKNNADSLFRELSTLGRAEMFNVWRFYWTNNYIPEFESERTRHDKLSLEMLVKRYEKDFPTVTKAMADAWYYYHLPELVAF